MVNQTTAQVLRGMVAAPLTDAEIAEISEALNDRGQTVTAIAFERHGNDFKVVIGEIREVANLDEIGLQPDGVNLDATWSGVSRGVYRFERSVLVIMDIDRIPVGAAVEEIAAAA